MSAITVGHPVALRRPIYGWALHDGFVVARRNLIQTLRVPELLFFSLVQPVISSCSSPMSSVVPFRFPVMGQMPRTPPMPTVHI